MRSWFNLLQLAIVLLFESSQQLAVCSKYCSTIAACLVMNKKMDVVKEMAAKLQVDLKSLLMNCLPHILVHILPLSAAAAADQQAKLTAVGFECYNMLIAELGKQVSTSSHTVPQWRPLFCILHCVPKKRPPFYFWNNSLKNQPISIIFCTRTPEKTWH